MAVRSRDMLSTFTGDGRRPCVVLLEPNVSLRRAIYDVLAAEEYHVQLCDSLEQAVTRAEGDPNAVGLIAWQSMEGLLADEHRHHLIQLTRRVRLVLMVPRRWRRLLDEADFGLAGLVCKPFDADELLAGLQVALNRPATTTHSPAPIAN